MSLLPLEVARDLARPRQNDGYRLVTQEATLRALAFPDAAAAESAA